MAENTISVIVVDDSAFMRKSISLMLEADQGIKVVATARDGKEAIEKIRTLKPDLVTLDVEMPVMDGLSALRIIMKEMPLPVIMISSLTSEGAQTTIEALNIGAVDFIPKELSYVSVNISKIKEELIAKVKNIAGSRSLLARMNRAGAIAGGAKPAAAAPAPSSVKLKRPAARPKAVVVGISTGGPFALLQVIPKLPADFPLGILVVQHMPPHFTKSMAERLNGLSQVEVREAANGDRIEPGLVLIAPGGSHMVFSRNGVGIVTRITQEPSQTLYRPSADVMINSAVEAFNAPLLGLIMTGMGKDGLEGLKALKKKNGYVVAQNEETCVVYGMPKAAVDAGVADAVLPLERIPSALVELTQA
ncbi:MAG: chemotaxis response regulator protein-glutamate methylesterase [Ignavibacteriae bacterium]|nr:chemotaxis response regulator protein-glutamate methylesterase [Ignavibacteriota bacterium]